MAKIIDPDDLNVGTEITFNLGSKTFTLVAAGNLVAKDGVTGNALWAKFVDLWTTTTYQPYPFPMNVLDARSGQYIFGQDPGGSFNGWKPADDTTRQMIRDAGWSEYSGAGALNRQYVGMVALASGFPGGAQFYYQLTSVAAAVNFTFTDAPNEAIQVLGDASNGNFDNRAFFKMFCREYNYSYDDAVLGDVGESGTGAYKVSLPLSVGGETKITANDAAMTGAPYTSILVRYFATSYNKDVDSATDRDFGIVIEIGTHSGVDGDMTAAGSTLTTALGGLTIATYYNGTLTIHDGTNKGVYTIAGSGGSATTVPITGTFPNSNSGGSFTLQRATPIVASLAQVYTKINYLLRQNSNINTAAGTVTGKTAGLLLNFVGDSLKCGFYAPTNPQGGGSGVMVEGVAAADQNSIVFYDNTAASREYPYASVGSINSNAALTAGGTGYYRMYFTTLPGASNDYGESGAVTVNDAAGNPITGTISSGVIAFTFDYTNNVQGGRTPGVDAAVTLVAGNAGSAKPVVVTGLLTASKTIVLTATAETDRAYLA